MPEHGVLGFDGRVVNSQMGRELGEVLESKACLLYTSRCVSETDGIPVEAELGALQGKEEDVVNESECKTDPAMVPEFVEQTGCDMLAVSVGNVHGLCLNPQIDIPLLARINEVSRVPLVLHGGSGIPKEVIWKAKQYGLIKINYGSDLRKEYIRTFGEAYEANHNEHDVIHLSVDSVKNVADKARELVTMINEH